MECSLGIAFSACVFEVKGANASMATDSVLTADCLSYSCGFNEAVGDSNTDKMHAERIQ